MAVGIILCPYLLKLLLNDSLISAKAEMRNSSILIAVLYMFALCVNVATYRLYDWTWIRFNIHLKKYIGETLFSRGLQGSYPFFQEQLSGALANNINAVIISTPQIIKITFDRFICPSMAIAFAIYLLSTVNYIFSTLLILWIFLFVVSTAYFSKHIQILTRLSAEARSHFFGHIVDTFINILNVLLFNSHTNEKNHLSQKLQDSLHCDRSRDVCLFYLYGFQAISFTLFQGACLWLLISGFVSNISVGDIALILLINTSVAESIWNFTKYFCEFLDQYATIAQSLKTISPCFNQVSPISVKTKQKSKDYISFENVNFKYNKGNFIFKDITLNIRQGQSIGIVGPVGSGKSTLAHLLLKLLELTRGEIRIEGENINNIPEERYRKLISYLSQEPTFFDRSIIDNIRYSLPTASLNQVYNAAKQVGMHEYIASLPEGYETYIGSKGISLSGGQRQSLAIARIYLKDTPIIILDEATCHLDIITEKEILKSVFSRSQDKTLFFITHQLRNLLEMDRILVISKGEILGDGLHYDLIERCSLYRSLWENDKSNF